MDTLIAFAIALVVTLFFVRHYLKRIEPAPGGDAPAAAPAASVTGCPRCGSPIAAGMAFCGACGAPMSLWNFQGTNFSEVQPTQNGTSSPRPVINASLCIGCGSCVDACPEEGALALVSGKAILANPDRCKAHGACVPVCPTSAVTLKTGNSSRQTLRVPAMNANLETNIPRLYIAGELGGMGLIKTSINEGRLVAEHIRARLATEPPNGAGGSYDVTVIGAGPAGLSASLTFHEQGIRYLALEQAEIASTIRQYPRKKFLMEEPVEMPLYGRLYIKDSSKESLLEVWEAIVANTGVEIHTNEKVEAIVRNPANQHFRIRTAHGEYETKYVVLAIGKRGTPRQLGVPGEEMAKVVYRLIEAESYDGNDVAVVGGGDSALEAAFALAKGGRNRVTLIHRGAEFPRVRERNRTRLAEAESAGLIRVLRDARIQSILSESIFVETPAGTEEIPNQFVFVLIGGESPEVFLQKIGVDIIERVVAA
jgi:thioredoxin reductase (NADPH)